MSLVKECPADAGHGSTSPQAAEPLATVEHGSSTNKSAPSGAQGRSDGVLRFFSRGVTAAPLEQLPRGAPNTRENARAVLLRDLAFYLRLMPSTIADFCLRRAEYETGRDFDRSVLPCLSWDHYLNHWRLWNRHERLFALRSAVYPALRGAATVAEHNGLALAGSRAAEKTGRAVPGAFLASCPSARPAEKNDDFECDAIEGGAAVFVADADFAAQLRRSVLAAGEVMGAADRKKMERLAELVTSAPDWPGQRRGEKHAPQIPISTSGPLKGFPHS